eukprot:529203-Karenia_brevis.AAC.1
MLATGELQTPRAWCQIPNCKSAIVRRDDSNTSSLFTHLMVHHNLDEQQVALQAIGKCRCGDDKCRPGILHGAPGARQDHLAAARLRVQQEAKNKLLAKARQANLRASDDSVFQEMDTDVKKLVDDAWVRLIVLGDLRPQAFCETANFQQFQRILAQALGSCTRWLLPAHSEQGSIIDAHVRMPLQKA